MIIIKKNKNFTKQNNTKKKWFDNFVNKITSIRKEYKNNSKYKKIQHIYKTEA